MTLPLIEPTLPGCVDGIIARDPWVVQCQECGVTDSGRTLILAMQSGIKFHGLGWPDGTNPRLCKACRLARCGECMQCRRERAGSEYP